MATEGGDYSWSRPDLDCLVSKGWRFIARYTQPDDRPKSLSFDEAKAALEAGLSLVTLHQPSGDKGWMTKGYDRGVQAARDALKIAQGECGMDDGRPIYYALDVESATLNSGQWDGVKQCLKGAASVTGIEMVGLYGDRNAMENLIPSLARWGYQTASWSGGVWSAKAQLQQYKHNVSLCGGQVDNVRAVADDYGQWDDP